MATKPDRLYMDRDSDKRLYDQLDRESLFKADRKEQFLLAMAFGFRNACRVPLRVREGLFLTQVMHPEDEALLDAVAVHCSNGDLTVIADRGKVYAIAEEYAHGGLRLLSEWLGSIQMGSANGQFELELREYADTIGVN
jgi:hypothetical protein